MCDKASECIMSIMAVSVLVYKASATLHVFIVMQIKLVPVVAVVVVVVVVVVDVLMSMYGHVSQRMLAIIKS